MAGFCGTCGQEGRCAICGTVPSVSLAADHDHITKKKRELLCTACNTGIGKIETISTERLAYLARHKSAGLSRVYEEIKQLLESLK
jgi:hypothetical protein